MCGVVGIVSRKPVAFELYEALIHLQNRGQDAAGISTYDSRFHKIVGKGLVSEVFKETDFNELAGNVGVGHVRYPTAGSFSLEDVQPMTLVHPYGIALAHNGNLVNCSELANLIQKTQRRHLNTDNDSELLTHLFANSLMEQPDVASAEDFFETLCTAVAKVFDTAKGAYSVVSSIVGKGLVAFRDPHGIRPLVIGARGEGEQKDYSIASEDTPFYSLDFKTVGNILPGELVYIDEHGTIFRRRLKKETFNPCIFEYVYFARPDAIINDISVYRSRLRMGQNLAKKWRNKFPDIIPDIVIPVPFSSNTAALTFSKELGVPYSEGLYKNPFIGRTFIMPNQEMRKRSVKNKLRPQLHEIRDKNVLLLDDSIVRGTTSQEIVKMVKEFGAKKVYFVSACPPIISPCYYGINIPTAKELIGGDKTVEQIKKYLGADELLYQEIDDLVEAVTRKGEHHISKPCLACMNGDYFCGVKK